ncbi:MAG: hypothetical protein ACK2US_01160 [Anaerolineae bacterium]
MTTWTIPFQPLTGEDAPAPEAIPKDTLAFVNDPERRLFVGMKDEG